ncbi:Gfo/Idh/MocA family protein [Salinibacterium sp. M195]|uniref:Gfo/Idh/MocA family protein n=1 Tax=Salinibacterium sp. M195 TaxID=2583374 RepID=UPI001C639E82|nr:Gfo/Idh/MocA family oxidoreductase [Salinibacterium sp. M195]QYH35270.1 Gfo/Idh/MocA family oxidoreductase [Salinibacterium sp. M195]
MSTLRIGVAGLGSIGRQHIAVLSKRGDVQTVGFDPSASLRDRVRDEFATEPAETLEALVDSGLDALVIASPDPFHLPQLAEAASRGIPTLVEKPLAPSLADRALIDRIRSSDSRVLMGYVLRHRAVVREVRTALQSGVIGKPTGYQVMLGAYGTIVAAESRFQIPDENRLLRDYSHEWDYLRWFFGPITETVAHTRVFLEVAHVESPNVADALLVHADGLSGAVHLDYVEPVGVRTIHVVGSGGSLFADLSGGQIRIRRAGADEEVRDCAELPAEALRRQADHLVAVAGGAQPIVTLDDGIAALAVAEAVARSVRERAWTTILVDSADLAL